MVEQLCSLCGVTMEFDPQCSMCDECDNMADLYSAGASNEGFEELSGWIEIDEDDIPEGAELHADTCAIQATGICNC